MSQTAQTESTLPPSRSPADKATWSLVKQIGAVLDAKKAKDIVLMQVGDVSSLADYFVLASGDSRTQVQATSDAIHEALKTTLGLLPMRYERDVEGQWHLLDYGDVVVHVFHTQARERYQLELFWSHGSTIPSQQWLPKRLAS